MRRVLLPLLLLGPVCLRCSSPLSEDPLVRFEDCDELQVFLEDRLLHPENTSGGGDIAVGCEAAPLSDANDPSFEGGGGRTFTTTNTQEVDVDEPDFVKNDGEHIFVLRRGRMIIVDAWPPEEATIVSETEIAGVPFTMFFDGEGRAMVFSRINDGFPAKTEVLLFDVTDRSNPILRRQVRIDAEYVDARRVGDDVVVVTRSLVGASVELRRDPFRDDENRRRLRAAGLEGMLPGLHERGGVDEEFVDDDAVTCGNAWAPRNAPSADLLLAHTISIADETATIHNTTIVGTPGSVYASTENLYVVGTEVFDGGHFTPDFAVTRIHKLGAFDREGRAPYLGSAVLEGRVKDQFSVDEDPASDTLRVVVTRNDDGNNDPLANTTALVVLEEGDDGRTLAEIARVDDIGHGEVVESVRFLGRRAYVVTFPSTAGEFAIDENGFPVVPFVDPLFVVDLEDPRAPLLRGALEVEGYSAYIHPIDEDHILTVGVQVDDFGAFSGLQLQIFDVTDLDRPRLAHKATFGDENSGSEALVEHHAFTYFPELRLLALPYQHLENDVVDLSALLVFHVDVGEGFRHVGTIDQLPIWTEELGGLPSDEAPCGSVRRSILMNDPELGAYAYAISTAGISVAALDDDSLEVTRTLPFRTSEVCDFGGTPL